VKLISVIPSLGGGAYAITLYIVTAKLIGFAFFLILIDMVLSRKC
jgi:hypothetical protein